MIYESTRKMTPNEQMAYDLGYNKAKAESAAQLAAVQAERDAAKELLRSVCLGADPCIACHWMTDRGPDFPCSKHSEWCGGTSWLYRGVPAPSGAEGQEAK